MRISLVSGTPAELVVPDGGAALGLVVGTDIWGLRPLFDAHAARFAAELPAVVCVPEPFPGRDDLGTDIDIARLPPRPSATPTRCATWPTRSTCCGLAGASASA